MYMARERERGKGGPWESWMGYDGKTCALTQSTCAGFKPLFDHNTN